LSGKKFSYKNGKVAKKKKKKKKVLPTLNIEHFVKKKSFVFFEV